MSRLIINNAEKMKEELQKTGEFLEDWIAKLSDEQVVYYFNLYCIPSSPYKQLTFNSKDKYYVLGKK